MIEPPRDFGRTGILEINDDVLVAIEMGFIKERPGPVQQPGKLEVHVAPDSFPVKA